MESRVSTVEGLSLSIHVYFLLDDPIEKLLNDVGFDLLRDLQQHVVFCTRASFLRIALKNGTELFKECSDSHVHNAFAPLHS